MQTIKELDVLEVDDTQVTKRNIGSASFEVHLADFKSAR
jgi:hypothetical protein